MKNKSNVFVIEDDQSVRESLALLLQQHGFQVQSYASAEAFLDGRDDGRPACLILDVRLTNMNGLDLQECLAERGIGIPVLMISAFPDAPGVVRAMKRGAVDFLEKPLDHDKLIASVNDALALDARRREASQEHRVLLERVRRLTPRETEVMHFVAAGLGNKKIAKELNRSDKTIEIHRAKVMRKMEARSLPDLVRMVEAIKRGSGYVSEPAPQREQRQKQERERVESEPKS